MKVQFLLTLSTLVQTLYDSLEDGFLGLVLLVPYILVLVTDPCIIICKSTLLVLFSQFLFFFNIRIPVRVTLISQITKAS